jgi:Tfp pilus assembly protein PilV
MTTRGDGAPGLTLVEFLFATSVIAFVLLGVAGMFPSALRTVVVGGHQTKASALATQMVEAIRNDRFDFLMGTYGGFDTRNLTVNCATLAPFSTTFDANYTKKKWTCDLAGTASQDSGQGLPDAYGTVAVTCRNSDGTLNSTTPCPTNLIRVVVTVFWGKNGERLVRYSTNVARRD